MRGREIAFLFAIGAAGGLVGDAGNVQSGADVYLDDTTPFIWKSPLWFVALVGLGTVSIGLTRLQLGSLRPGFDPRIGVGAIAAVIAIYAISSLVPEGDAIATVALCSAIAALLASFVGDRRGMLCGLAAAVAGPAVEIAVVELDGSYYNDLNDGLFGVPLWLPPLYFAFGVAVSRITELMVARRATGS